MNSALIFITGTSVLALVSFILDKKKTFMGIKKGIKMLAKVLLPFINILIIISFALYFISPNVIAKYLGANSGIMGLVLATIVGAVTLIPGFISYPLAGALLKQGASYAAVATFITSLMLVGVVTLPLEIKYFGKRTAILRNVLNLIFAVLIGLLVGIIMAKF